MSRTPDRWLRGEADTWSRLVCAVGSDDPGGPRGREGESSGLEVVTWAMGDSRGPTWLSVVWVADDTKCKRLQFVLRPLKC